MSKIIKALLELKFSEINVDNLLDIIVATPNPEIATEVICGIYKPPVISKVAKDTDTKVNRTFISFNKYENTVHFSYQERRAKHIDVRKDSTEEPTFETKGIEGYYLKDKAKTLGITEDEFIDQYKSVTVFGKIDPTIRTSYTSLKDWNNSK